MPATYDGNAITFTSAVAVERDDGQYWVYLKSFPFTCSDAFTGSARSSEQTDVELDLRIGRFISADGKLAWAVRGRYFSARAKDSTTQTEKEDGGDPLTTPIVTDEDAKFPLALKLEQVTPGDGKLVIDGNIEVTQCGAKPGMTKEATPAPLGDGVIEIAGQKLPVGGAGLIVSKSGDRNLEIATHPVKCVDGMDYTSSRADVRIQIAWDKAGKLYRNTMLGYFVDHAVNQKDPGLDASPSKGSGKETKVKLKGETTINGYAVKLSGTVPAIVCPTPK